MTATLLVLVLALGGCTGRTAGEPVPSHASSASTAPGDGPTDDGGPTAPPSGPAGDVEAARCPPATTDHIRVAVIGQLDAIRDRDWDTALSFATTDFRARFDAATFEEVITGSFPVVADSTGADIEACRLTHAQRATVLVTVEDSQGTQRQLVYMLELEDEWAIAGAVPAESDDPDDGGIVA